jgi:hypothetical protein
MESETSLNGYLLAFTSTLCAVKYAPNTTRSQPNLAGGYRAMLRNCKLEKDAREAGQFVISLMSQSVGSTDTLWCAFGDV